MIGAFFTPERSDRMQIGTKKITWRLSAAVVTKVALLTALAFVLYIAKFNLPFMLQS